MQHKTLYKKKQIEKIEMNIKNEVENFEKKIIQKKQYQRSFDNDSNSSNVTC